MPADLRFGEYCEVEFPLVEFLAEDVAVVDGQSNAERRIGGTDRGEQMRQADEAETVRRTEAQFSAKGIAER